MAGERREELLGWAVLQMYCDGGEGGHVWRSSSVGSAPDRVEKSGDGEERDRERKEGRGADAGEGCRMMGFLVTLFFPCPWVF